MFTLTGRQYMQLIWPWADTCWPSHTKLGLATVPLGFKCNVNCMCSLSTGGVCVCWSVCVSVCIFVCVHSVRVPESGIRLRESEGLLESSSCANKDSQILLLPHWVPSPYLFCTQVDLFLYHRVTPCLYCATFTWLMLTCLSLCFTISKPTHQILVSWYHWPVTAYDVLGMCGNVFHWRGQTN